MPSEAEVDARKAVQIAAQYLSDLYGNQAIDILLEEIERNTSGTSWLVTLSFIRPGPPVTSRGQLANILGQDSPRRYKVLEIGVEDGSVRSMKIRPNV